MKKLFSIALLFIGFTSFAQLTLVTNKGNLVDTSVITQKVKDSLASHRAQLALKLQDIVGLVTGAGVTGTGNAGSPYNIAVGGSKSTPFAKPAPFGDILNITSFQDLSAFGTPGGTATMSLVGNALSITASDISWANTIAVLPARATMLRNKTISVDFKSTSNSASTSFFGIGLKNIIGPLAPYVYINTTNGASKGALAISTSGGAIANGAGTPVSLNEWATLTISVNDSSVSASVYNWNTGLTSPPLVFNYTIASVTLPSLCAFSIVSFGAGVSTQLVRSIKVSSNSLKNGNTLLVGDSKTQAYFATYWATRYGAQLASQYNFVDIFAGGSLQAAHLTGPLYSEFMALNYRNVIFNIGCNDIRGGTSLTDLTTTLNSLFKTLQNGGVKVALTVVPEDSTIGGIGLALFKNWAASNQSLATYIDSWTPMSSGNKLLSIYNNGDGIHPNQAGNNVMDSIIVASGFIKNIDTVGSSRYRATDNLINQTGDSLSINLKINPTIGAVPLWGNNNTIGASIITQAGNQLNIPGNIQMYGAGATLALTNRNDANLYHSFQLTNSSNRLLFFDVYNNRVAFSIDTSGRMTVGNPFGGGSAYFIPHQSTSTNYAMIIPAGSSPSAGYVTDGGIRYDSLFIGDSKPHLVATIKGVDYVLDNAAGGLSFISSITNTGTSGPTTVTSGVLNSPIYISSTGVINYAHPVGSTGTPTLLGGSLGGNVTGVTITGNDAFMKVAITTSGAVSGTICTINYTQAWAAAPMCVISASIVGSASAITANGISTTTMGLAGALPTAAGTYTYTIFSGN